MKFTIISWFVGILFFFLPNSLQSQEIEWEEVTNGIQVPYVLSIHEDYEGGIYANTGGGLYYSSDHGENWEKICDSTFKYLLVINRNVFVGANYKSTLYNLTRTLNRGKTWETLKLPINKEFYIEWLFNDFKGNIYTKVSLGSPFIRKSQDLGVKWDTVSGIPNYHSLNKICEGKKDHIYFTVPNDATYLSKDAGNTASLITIENGTSIGADKIGNIWIIGTNSKFVYSLDEGKNWHNELSNLAVCNSPTPYTSDYLLFTTASGANQVVYIPSDSSFLSVSYGCGIFKLSIPQKVLVPLVNNVPNRYVNCLFRDSVGYIYAGTQGGIYRSSDNGMSWHLKAKGMNEGSNIFDFLVEPSTNQIFVATSAGIFRSPDNLRSWEWLINSMSDAYTTSLGRAKNGNLLAGNLHGLYYSTNNGADWKKSNMADDKYVSSILRVPNGNLFAACDRTNPAISTDNGLTWRTVGTEEPCSRLAYNAALDGVFGVAKSEYIMQLSPKDGAPREYWNAKKPQQAYDVTCDSTGRLFFSASSGMHVSTNGESGSISFIPAGDISRFAFTANNQLIAGTLSGDVWVQKGNGFGATIFSKGLEQRPIRALAVLPDQRVLVGTDRGLFVSKTPVVIAELPTLQQPANGSHPFIAGIKPTWSGVTKFKYYHLQVARDSMFTDFVVNDSTLITQSFSLPILEQGRTYYWRVRTTLQAQRSDWTPVWTFTTLPDVPKMPQLQFPENNTNVNGASTTLQWKAGQYAERYRLQVSNVPNFATILVEDSTLTTESYELQNLGQDTKYYWRVHSINLTGSSSWTTPWSFVANPNIGVEEPQTGGIQVYPNPANEEIIVQFPLLSTKGTELTLTSSRGEIVKRLIIAESITDMKIGVKDLASGRYSLQVTSGSIKSTLQITIQR